MKLRSILLAGVFALAGGSAIASDLSSLRLPPPAPVAPAAPAVSGFNWTGFTAGGQLGVGWDIIGVDNAQRAAWAGALYGPIGSPNSFGFIGGLNATANYQLPSNIVLGGVIEGNLSDQRQTNTNGVDFARARVDSFGLIGGRAGYAYQQFLPYAIVGLGYEHLRVSTSVPAFAAGSADNFGLAVGTGVDYAVTPQAIVGLGYRFLDFPNDHSNSLGTSIGGNQHILQINAGYKF